eukprot:s1740_g5.t1
MPVRSRTVQGDLPTSCLSFRAMPARFLSLLLPAISLASDRNWEHEAMQMQLLQHKFALEDVAGRSLKEAEPLDWIHFPKTGSSFVNAISST